MTIPRPVFAATVGSSVIDYRQPGQGLVLLKTPVTARDEVAEWCWSDAEDPLYDFFNDIDGSCLGELYVED